MVEYSLYFHIPFCKRKCDYCHFYVTRKSEAREGLLLESLAREWENVQPLVEGLELKTIYFGGGTPSLAKVETLANILSWLPKAKEITLEANPDDISAPYADKIAALGINRVSLGVQTLSGSLLKTIGRTHSAQKALEAVEILAKAGFHNLSLDLMLDLPNQTLLDVRSTLSQIALLPITHVSLYNLVLESPSLFYNRREEVAQAMPNDETSLAMLEETIDSLEAAGLKRYEISAFAKPGYESLHNTGYWTARPFLGLGPSAFSYWEGRRFRNVGNLEEYAKHLKDGRSPVDFEERLPPERKWRELFVVGLRLITGVEMSHFCSQHGPRPKDLDLDPLFDEGLLTQTEDRIALTDRGRLFYDTVASDIVTSDIITSDIVTSDLTV